MRVPSLLLAAGLVLGPGIATADLNDESVKKEREATAKVAPALALLKACGRTAAITSIRTAEKQQVFSPSAQGGVGHRPADWRRQS